MEAKTYKAPLSNKMYVFTVTCKVPIEARSREEANEIFAEE